VQLDEDGGGCTRQSLMEKWLWGTTTIMHDDDDDDKLFDQ